MSSIIAFTSRATQQQLDNASKWLDLLECKYHLYNIPHHRPENLVKENTIVVTFGKVSSKSVQQVVDEKQLRNVKHLSLPPLKDLTRSEQNRATRQESLDQIRKLKDYVKSDLFRPANVVVTEQDLPELDAKQLLLLKKITDDQEKTSCFQTTRGGKLIEISNEHLEESKADIHLTFSEIFTIRSLMDVLGVTEVELVPSSKATGI